MSHVQILPPSNPIDPISYGNTPWHPQGGRGQKLFYLNIVLLNFKHFIFYESCLNFASFYPNRPDFLPETPPDTPRVDVAQKKCDSVCPSAHVYLQSKFGEEWSSGLPVFLQI